MEYYYSMNDLVCALVRDTDVISDRIMEHIDVTLPRSERTPPFRGSNPGTHPLSERMKKAIGICISQQTAQLETIKARILDTRHERNFTTVDLSVYLKRKIESNSAWAIDLIATLRMFIFVASLGFVLDKDLPEAAVTAGNVIAQFLIRLYETHQQHLWVNLEIAAFVLSSPECVPVVQYNSQH